VWLLVAEFTKEIDVSTDETIEDLANIVGEMRDSIREKLENMEAEGVTCVPISDVRFILTEHYNLMHQLIYETRQIYGAR
jgi:hypothetical protein